MRALLCLLLLPFVSLAQEAQPLPPPAIEQPTPQESRSLYANLSLQGWSLLLAGSVGVDAGLGLRLPTSRPSTPKRSSVDGFWGVEANAHAHKFGAISSDTLTFAGGDLSVRVGSEAARRDHRRRRGRSLRLGAGLERVSVSSQGDPVPSARSVYGVVAGDLYLISNSALRLGVGATVYVGTPTETQTGAQFVNLFPTLDLLKLSLLF